MTAYVVDASAMLAWCFDDEKPKDPLGLLRKLKASETWESVSDIRRLGRRLLSMSGWIHATCRGGGSVSIPSIEVISAKGQGASQETAPTGRPIQILGT